MPQNTEENVRVLMYAAGIEVICVRRRKRLLAEEAGMPRTEGLKRNALYTAKKAGNRSKQTHKKRKGQGAKIKSPSINTVARRFGDLRGERESGGNAGGSCKKTIKHTQKDNTTYLRWNVEVEHKSSRKYNIT